MGLTSCGNKEYQFNPPPFDRLYYPLPPFPHFLLIIFQICHLLSALFCKYFLVPDFS